VALVAQGKFRQAHDLISEAIPFPGICGRVCYHPCEGQCSRRELDEAIAVRPLKRFVADYVAGREGLRWDKPTPDPTMPPVAVVGAGPAGLTVAWVLARKGARVTVFEALPMAGGMMAVGIPAYRLPREDLQREIAAIESLGVEFRFNTPLGSELTIDNLFGQGYGAIFLGLGAHKSRQLEIPGEDLEGVVHAIDLLRAVSLLQEEGIDSGVLPQHLKQHYGLEIGRRVVVVGGGNTAVDAARTLLRLGAEEAHILYRRSRLEMPALPEEILAAEQEGIVLKMLAAPVRLLGKDGQVQSIECVRMELGEPDESGRRRPIPIKGSEFVLEADMVVPAIGQRPELPPLPQELCDNGWLRVDPETGRTPVDGVFAAGDIVRVASVIDAIGAGKRVAEQILRFLRGEEQPVSIPERPVVRLSVKELEGRVEQTRQHPPELAQSSRRQSFAEVERAFTAEQAIVEANRCLACAVCSECMECVDVCQPQAINHRAQPRRLTLEADAMLLAGEYDVALSECVHQVDESDPGVAVQGILGALVQTGDRPSQLRRRALQESSSPSRLGVFLCQCGDQIAGTVDLDLLQKKLATIPGVVRVEQVAFACLPEGIDFLRQAAADLDGAVLGACSCCNLAQVCYSCTSQRVRCREGMGLWEDTLEGTLPAWAWEYVNLREHGAWVHPEDTLAQAEESLAAAVARLAAGPALPLLAQVDAALCRACGTCQDLCRAEAIHLQTDTAGHTWAQVDQGRCLACGSCAAHCPTGAIVAGRVSDRQIELTCEALLSGTDDRILVFTCNWGGHSGAEAIGMRRQPLPAGVRVVRVPCLGRLSPGLLLRALEQGASGVLLAGCHEEGCRFDFGRDVAADAFGRALSLLDLLGLGTYRLRMEGIAPGDATAFDQAVRQFIAQLQQAHTVSAV
jgi:NADPH-dependent glutamate synthase beta subunit-like oxidoreductase/coenzyme F420-reducing hydrogenase delta subunit/NAD-dependent dihydropyrimidine dehydrogenase PreA subunit